MLYWGKFKDRGKVRKKFVCPITHSKKFAEQLPPAHGTIPPSKKEKAVSHISEAIKRSENKSTMAHKFLKNITTKEPAQRGPSQDSLPLYAKTISIWPQCRS